MSTQVALQRRCRYCDTLTASTDGFCCSACRLLSDEGWSEAARHAEPSTRFRAYEADAVRSLYNHSPGKSRSRYRFSVEGLQCSSCVHLIEKLPEYLPEVARARVNFARGELDLECDREHSLARLLSFVGEMGYEARPLRPSEDGRDQRAREDRDMLRRLGVAGACAGNIMLMTVPVYAGVAAGLAQVFHWISFALFLPIVGFATVPLYRTAWGSLKMRHLSVDTPLVVALWFGFIASVVNLVRGTGGIYFDSTAGFLFLILVSRWFLRASQRRWLQSPLAATPWSDELVRVIRGNEELRLPASEIQVGDRVSLHAQAIVPVDGNLTSARALFDTSWMTGEPVPRVSLEGAPVSAGFRVLGTEVSLRATSTVAESELARGLRRVESECRLQGSPAGPFDKAAQRLLVFVFGVAALLIAIAPWIGLSPQDALERALSVLIVACPCALAFGGPLAYGMAMRRAAREGLLLRSPEVLDRVLECDHLVFDKTGTLTEGQLHLVRQSPTDLPDWMKDLILSLENASRHPVAEAFRQLWAARPHTALDLQDVHEYPGEKVFGLYRGRVYSLQAAPETSGSLAVTLSQDGHEIARFEFEDQVRAEAPALLRGLARRFRITVLSGDRELRVRRVLRDLNVSGLDGRGDARPADKAAFVRTQGHCLMIGDGLNDAEALATAHVGVALNGSLEQGLTRASVYLLKPGLAPIVSLFDAAARARRLIRRNLAFALLYNLGAGCAALLGFVGPLGTAALMPVSSLLILISTWEGSR